jgi:lipopolysaccharide export system permease protein
MRPKLGQGATKLSGNKIPWRLTSVDRYITRLILLPLLSTLVIAAMLLLLDKMLRLFDFVVSEGGPVNVVWKMLANMLPEYLSLGVPIGLLLGVLLAFRKLALNSELDALLASGFSYTRLLFVPMLFAVGLAIVNFGIVGFAQPLSRYAYEGLRFELRSGALGASIKVGEFARLGKRMTFRVEESQDSGRRLIGIFLRAADGDKTLAVAAQEGQFFATDDPDTIILRLKNGTLIHNAPAYQEPRVLSFAAHDLPIELPRIEAFRNRGGKDLELTIPELVRVGVDPQQPVATRLASVANFNFRLAEVVVMFVLPFLAVALAVPPKRSSSGLGVFLAIVLVVTWHKANEYAEQMGTLGRIDPWIALWIPFAIFTALSLWLYHTLAHVPGGQPIGALDRAFAVAWGKMVRIFRGLARIPAPAAGG